MYSLEGVEGLATLTVETCTSLRPEQPNLKSKLPTHWLGFDNLLQCSSCFYIILDIIIHFDRTELHQCYIQSLHVVVLMQNWIQFEQIEFDHHGYMQELVHPWPSCSVSVVGERTAEESSPPGVVEDPGVSRGLHLRLSYFFWVVLFWVLFFSAVRRLSGVMSSGCKWTKWAIW